MRSLMIGLLFCAPLLPAQETKPQTPKERYEALLKEFKEAEEAWNKRYNVDTGRDAKVDWEARYRDWPGWSFPPRFLRLAEENPKDAVAIEALLQIVVELRQGVSENAARLLPHYARAVELLARDHVDDRRLAVVCRDHVARDQSPPAEKFLRTVLEKSWDREVRGMACMGLANYLVKKRQTVLRPWFEDKDRSPFLSFLIKSYDPSYVRYIRESDPRALSQEAEGLFERAVKEFGDIVYWRDPRRPDRQETIAGAAEMMLNDLHASIGKVAPEIEGKDIDGEPMKLGDYRGKVVMLSFWGSWCGPCMALVPHERALAERLAGKPFVLLGVNSDEDPGQAKKVIRKEEMAWRSWSDGIPPGRIATRYGVRGWPTLYLIDAKGVIRHIFHGDDKNLDEALNTLLKEIEAEGPR
jgi:thiol-disulfide isomerase/thioredoxin